MKIEYSSAEFELNSNTNHTLFNSPKFFVGGELICPLQLEKYHEIKNDDISKLNMWLDYREEINQNYSGLNKYLKKDVNGQWWLTVGFTGGAVAYTVNLGEYKINE